MFKLKIIDKPKVLKMKCSATFPPIILANLQEKETIPTKETQEIVADKTYDGLSKVTVHPIPNEYIVPSGEVEFTQNGTYDVTDKASAKVNIKEKVLGTKTITSNGIYKAIDDNLDGYSEVEVATSGVDIWNYFEESPTNVNVNNHEILLWLKSIPQIDLSKTTSMSNMFYNCRSLYTIPLLDTSHILNMEKTFYECRKLEIVPQLDTSNVTTMYGCFDSCSSLKTIPLLNTSKVTTMNSMFEYSGKLETIPQIDMGNVENVANMFYVCSRLKSLPKLNWQKVKNVNTTFNSCNDLVDLGGFENLGMAYETTQVTNYTFYGLKFQQSYNLTHDSLMNVINNLYDIKTKGVKPQQLVLGTSNLAKLSEEEIAIAQNKGWSLS